MVRTAVQLFTLQDVDEPVQDVVARVGETTFNGVELYDAHFDELDDEDALRRTSDALEDADLDVVSAHVDIDRLESSLEDVVRICDAVGCSTLVIPTYEPDAFTTRDGIEAAADRIGGLAGDLAEHNLDLLYHNHTFEFAEVDDEVGFELFVDAADGRFEFQPDVGLAAHAGYDALDLLDVVDGLAPIVHLTDSVPGDEDTLHVDVGEGVVDVDACAATAADIGADWLVCENGRTTDALASLEHGSEAFADFREQINAR